MDHAPIRRALVTVIEHLAPVSSEVDFRLVGTAAALLHGVHLPVRDVDILVKHRNMVDVITDSLSEFRLLVAPAWLEEDRQYFARIDLGGVDVEISTVEWATDSDAIECLGVGPWDHCVWIPCGPRSMPTVALELRLVSEVTRDRSERYIPIAAHLRAHGCDVALVIRGLRARGVPGGVEHEVLILLGEAKSRRELG